MARRWIRFAIVLVTLASLGFTANQLRLAEETLDDEQNIERVFTDLSWALTLALGDLRAGQQAYVAAGQDRVYWASRVNSHLDTVRDSLENLRRLAATPASIEALDATEGAIADLRGLDQRARGQADLGQPLLASDLIFTDGLELATRAAANVELARATERTTRNDSIRTARAGQTTMLAVSAGASVLALLLLAPLAGGKASSAFESPDGAIDAQVGEDVPALSSDDGSMLSHLDLATTRGTAHADRSTSAHGSTTTADATAAHEGPPTPDLRAAAELCTDLSVLADTRELPALLARAATLINASGLIVWVRDSTGHALRPAVGHGYSAQALARIGSIPEDGSNATAAAFRSGGMQVVDRADGTSGALAIPLRSADRCIGVLSAELRDGWESSDAVQASAAIVAAQLSTMLPAQPPAEATIPVAEGHG